MKLVCFMLMMLIAEMSASVYSQTKKLNARLTNVTVKEVLKNMENQSEFRFFYSDDLSFINKVVSIDAKELSVEDMLQKLLHNSDLTFQVFDNNLIIITPKKAEQQLTVSGTVTDAGGAPLPGVNVIIKGTSIGVVTDINGRYSINIPDKGAVISFSFIGYATQEIVAGDQAKINIKLDEDTKMIEEVVVTALGISKSKRSLAYSTEQVNMNAVNTVKSVNLGDALYGKVAGITITSSYGSTGVNSNPRIDIRGNRTIDGNNQPLIVVDGVIYGQSGGGLTSLNSDDIESMNVLKGPSAAALYGSNANNGVIVVTTKKGREGVRKLEINSLTMLDFVSVFPELQNEYGQGSDNMFVPSADRFSWGPKMDGRTVTNWTGEEIPLLPQPDNMKDLFRVGMNFTNSIAYSGGNNKSSYYFSYRNTTAKGILETNELQRHYLNTRITAELFKNVTADVKLNYYGNYVTNSPEGGDGTWSPMHMLLVMPRSIRTQDIEQWTYIDEYYNTKQKTWCPGSQGTYNPYFSMNARQNPSTTNNLSAIASIRWDMTNFLYVQLRGNVNVSNTDSELKIMYDAPYTNSGKGDYQTAFSKGRQYVGDVLVGFDKDLIGGFKLNANLGAEIKDNYYRSMESIAGGLSIENEFYLGNGIKPSTIDGESRIQRQSVYGMAQLSYKNMLFLDVTARKEWASTLPAPYTYFYPSFGLTGVLSDMLSLPEFISYAKVRATWAEVGNAVGFSKIYQSYTRQAKFPLGGISMSGTKVATRLIPERTRSMEFGGEIKFFNNRLGFDFTWYKTNSFNQLITIGAPAASGFTNAQVNCGDLQNKGIELMISATPVKTRDFVYDVYITYAKNKNVIKELIEGTTQVTISTPTQALGTAYAMVDRPYGELFDFAMIRNDDGQLIINPTTGLPSQSTDPVSYYLGNQNYDWKSSINNSFTYKNWNLNFLIDLNVGGVRQSATESAMLLSGTSKESLNGREGDLVIDGVIKNSDDTFSPNTKQIDAYTWATFVGGRSGVGELYNYKATNSRLRELSVGYRMSWSNNFVKSLHVSLVGRNLFYFYNGCHWFDPDQSSDVSRNGQGSEVSFLPQVRSFGINLKAEF